jgi:hypothetical protein
MGGNVADETDANERQTFEPEAAQADKKGARWSSLIIWFIPLLGAMLPRPYRDFTPLLFLIPVVFSLVSKYRKSEAESRSSTPTQTYPPPDQVHPVEPYLYTPTDPKDPRRYKPIG